MNDKSRWAMAPSGLYLIEETYQAEMARYRRPIGLDLFAGCGGMSLGFIQAGYEVIGAVEMDIYAVITYMTNLCRYGQCKMHFVTEKDKARMERALSKAYTDSGLEVDDSGIVTGGSKSIKSLPVAGSGWISKEPSGTPGVSNVIIGDVRELTGDRLLSMLDRRPGEIDVVFGGPPCQGFSRAGSRNVMDPRNSLVFDFLRLVLDVRPKAMAMENVPGIEDMTTPEGIPILDAAARILEDGSMAGYEAFKRMLSTGQIAGRLRAKSVVKGSDSHKAAKQSAQQEDLFA